MNGSYVTRTLVSNSRGTQPHTHTILALADQSTPTGEGSSVVFLCFSTRSSSEEDTSPIASGFTGNS